MSLEQLSSLAQIIGSVGLIVSLIFVGLQIKHNTAALQRNEHNSTMAQWTVIRMAIAKNRDIAELMTAGLDGERSPRCRRSAEAGANAAGKRLGILPHLGENAARYFPEGDLRVDGRTSLERPAQNGARRAGGAAPNIPDSFRRSSLTSTRCSRRRVEALQPTAGRHESSKWKLESRMDRRMRALIRSFPIHSLDL